MSLKRVMESPSVQRGLAREARAMVPSGRSLTLEQLMQSMRPEIKRRIAESARNGQPDLGDIILKFAQEKRLTAKHANDLFLALHPLTNEVPVDAETIRHGLHFFWGVARAHEKRE